MVGAPAPSLPDAVICSHRHPRAPAGLLPPLPPTPPLWRSPSACPPTVSFHPTVTAAVKALGTLGELASSHGCSLAASGRAPFCRNKSQGCVLRVPALEERAPQPSPRDQPLFQLPLPLKACPVPKCTASENPNTGECVEQKPRMLLLLKTPPPSWSCLPLPQHANVRFYCEYFILTKKIYKEIPSTRATENELKTCTRDLCRILITQTHIPEMAALPLVNRKVKFFPFHSQSDLEKSNRLGRTCLCLSILGATLL